MSIIRCLAAPGRETEGEESGMKDMTLGRYQVRFADGGIRVLKNGSFYDVDTGAEPHFFIADPTKYYDREALTEFIHGLY